jgi:hypothetical protein
MSAEELAIRDYAKTSAFAGTYLLAAIAIIDALRQALRETSESFNFAVKIAADHAKPEERKRLGLPDGPACIPCPDPARREVIAALANLHTDDFEAVLREAKTLIDLPRELKWEIRRFLEQPSDQ